jgi:hypothetical protein
MILPGEIVLKLSDAPKHLGSMNGVVLDELQCADSLFRSIIVMMDAIKGEYMDNVLFCAIEDLKFRMKLTKERCAKDENSPHNLAVQETILHSLARDFCWLANNFTKEKQAETRSDPFKMKIVKYQVGELQVKLGSFIGLFCVLTTLENQTSLTS